MKRKTILLYIPLFLIMTADLLLTLFGLSKSYWRGDYHRAYYEEASIIGQWLLSVHPYVFIGSFIVYLALTYFAIKRFNEFFKFALFFSLLVNHSIGAAGWLKRLVYHNFSVSNEMTNTTVIGIFTIFALFVSWMVIRYKNLQK